jgi:hypothetical protein
MKKHEKRLAEICISAQIFLMTYYRDTPESDRSDSIEEFMNETIEVLERAVERARNHDWSFEDREFEIRHLTRVLYDLREIALDETDSFLFVALTEYLNKLDKLYERLTKRGA